MSDPAEAHGESATWAAEVMHQPGRVVELTFVFAAHIERTRERPERGTTTRCTALARYHEALQRPEDGELHGIDCCDGCRVQRCSK